MKTVHWALIAGRLVAVCGGLSLAALSGGCGGSDTGTTGPEAATAKASEETHNLWMEEKAKEKSSKKK